MDDKYKYTYDYCCKDTDVLLMMKIYSCKKQLKGAFDFKYLKDIHKY